MVLYLVLHLYQLDSLSRMDILGEKKSLIEQPQVWGFILPCFFFRYCFNIGITPYTSPSNILRPVCFFFIICKCFRDRSLFCRCDMAAVGPSSCQGCCIHFDGCSLYTGWRWCCFYCKGKRNH